MSKIAQSKPGSKQWIAPLITILLIVTVIVFRQTLIDSATLLTYKPPAPIQEIATETTMTNYAKRLFFVNHPQLEDKANFRRNCPVVVEKTIILGCYRSQDGGIHILSVDDKRLDGVEQVTAAHEMLHAAYDRLSKQQKATLDQELNTYFKTVTDQQLISIIDSYRKSDPDNLFNEMHSIFGSQVADLPSSLESYYKQYFTDRQIVTDLADQYQDTFHELEERINQYDKTLAKLRKNIEQNKTSMNQLRQSMNSYRSQLASARAQQDWERYNIIVPRFNAQAQQYNQLLKETNSQINRYNQLVKTRNNSAITINQLQHKLDADYQPAGTINP